MVTGELVTVDGAAAYRIAGVEEMEPFLVTVVSDGDLWMYASSTGSLTAGRRDADHSLFPYVTDDKIHRAAGQVGPVSVIARVVDGHRRLWRPFHAELTPGCTRSLAKSLIGDRLVAEEHHHDWALRFRATWAPSTTYGWVRTVELIDEGRGVDLEVLDGLLDVQPAGVDAHTSQIRSNLVNAYKRSETGPWGTLAIYNLESLVTDRAEPAEALTATTVWSWGFDGAEPNLDARSVAAMLDGRPTATAELLTGRPGSYLLRGPVSVPAGGRVSWSIVADTGLDHAAVLATARIAIAPDAAQVVSADVEAGSAELRDLLADADGFQTTAEPVTDAHHVSNVLFNCMRGGVLAFGNRVPTDDVADFVAARNPAVAERHERLLRGLDEWIDVRELRATAQETGDPDLVRLVLEYLPLTYSRRHGDPSRPWNTFSIRTRDESGRRILTYEGNWRDIFQNWEALLYSFPAYFVGVIATFVNASTLDGYNAYRISRDGIDWEVPDPDDPWSNIGYWGDHQIVYLLRLLEGWERHEPGSVRGWLAEREFVYADVPYVVADHAEMIRHPRDTITFDAERAQEIAAREEQRGGDGRLVVDREGALLRANLAEKLLVPALAKLSSFVPGGGIWMNTQRPEWNDANNALAGSGLSMVTLYHLHRYLRFLTAHLPTDGHVVLTSTVATWVTDLADAFDGVAAGPADDTTRRGLLDAVATAGDAHRARMRHGDGLGAAELPVAEVHRLLTRALAHLDVSLQEGRRGDGLFHSYNLVSFPSDDTAHVDHLGAMLEGQVAVLSSGALDPEESLQVVDALFGSEMYRTDIGSFLLYPPVQLPSFLDRNVVPDDQAAQAGADRAPDVILTTDPEGRRRFRPDATNAEALAALLDGTDLDGDARAALEELYEATFRHASFTGRSGSMYGYEGIGSVYWHMVAKLLLAVQETYWSATDDGADADVIARLATAYGEVRAGLGFRKDPAHYGAFPTDCYSHTPAHAGAQQPGMTGQVKEEILTRFGELGVRVKDGRLLLEPGLLPLPELVPEGERAPAVATFTYCAVPMTLRRGDVDHVAVTHGDGRREGRRELALTYEESQAVFDRRGEITHVDWTVGPPVGRRTD